MKTIRAMSLVAATVFALGVAGPALAQTPTTPAPSTTPAPKSDTQMDKMDKKDNKGAAKHKKKHAAKKSEGDATKTPDTKSSEQPKK